MGRLTCPFIRKIYRFVSERDMNSKYIALLCFHVLSDIQCSLGAVLELIGGVACVDNCLSICSCIPHNRPVTPPRLMASMNPSHHTSHYYTIGPTINSPVKTFHIPVSD